VNHRGVEQIVLLAQGDKEARRWLTAIINPPEKPKGEPGKTARDLIKMIIKENKDESEDDEIEQFQGLENLLEELDEEYNATSVHSNTATEK